MFARIPGQPNSRRLHLALFAGSAVIFLGAVLTSVLSFVSLSNYSRNVDRRAESRQVLLSAHALEASLREAEILSWRYVFTGDSTFADRFEAVTTAATADMAEFAALVGDVGHYQVRLQELEVVVPGAIAGLGAAIEMVRLGPGSDAALPQLSGAEHRTTVDRAHAILAGVTGEENERIGALTEQTDRRATTLAYSVSLLAVVNLALLAMLALYLRRRSHEALLRQSNEAKDQFIGLVSHELRNPIGTIMNAASILQCRGEALSLAEREDLLRGIGDDARRLDRRVTNMLVLARPEAAQSVLEPLLLQRLVPRVVDIHRHRFPTREVVLTLDDNLPLVDGDASYVEEVLLNFLGNAEKYGHPTEAIDVEVCTTEAAVKIAVLDRGEGIDPSDAERVFQPFFRTDGARRTAAGYGLGLTVSRRLVELQHGRICAAPRTGGGSVFAFTLPRAAEIQDEPLEELAATNA